MSLPPFRNVPLSLCPVLFCFVFSFSACLSGASSACSLQVSPWSLTIARLIPTLIPTSVPPLSLAHILPGSAVSSQILQGEVRVHLFQEALPCHSSAPWMLFPLSSYSTYGLDNINLHSFVLFFSHFMHVDGFSKVTPKGQESILSLLLDPQSTGIKLTAYKWYGHVLSTETVLTSNFITLQRAWLKRFHRPLWDPFWKTHLISESIFMHVANAIPTSKTARRS